MSGNVRHLLSPALRAAGAMIVTLALVGLVSGCSQESSLTGAGRGGSDLTDPTQLTTPPPSGPVTVTVGTESLTFWP